MGVKILLIGPYPMHDGMIVGGVESVVSTLAPALADHESVDSVTVLSFHRGLKAAQCSMVNDKLRVWHLPGQRFKVLTRSFLEVKRARRIAAALEPDIVHGHGVDRHGHIATMLSDSAIVTVHGLYHREAHLARHGQFAGWLRARLIDSLVKRVLRRASLVISISAYDARELGPLVHGRQVSIPNPVPAEFFAEPCDQPDGGMRILFAGMLVRRKNVDGLIRAFALARALAPGARLIITGPAPDPVYQAEIRAQVESLRLGDAVTLVGHVENARLLHEMRACRVVALFSHEETSPTVVAQAMAMGKPVVAAAVGGIPELVVEGETGFLVDPGDERALAQRLATLVSSPLLCRTMGARARSLALQRCNPATVAERTLEAYRLVLPATPRAQQVLSPRQPRLASAALPDSRRTLVDTVAGGPASTGISPGLPRVPPSDVPRTANWPETGRGARGE